MADLSYKIDFMSAIKTRCVAVHYNEILRKCVRAELAELTEAHNALAVLDVAWSKK